MDQERREMVWHFEKESCRPVHVGGQKEASGYVMNTAGMWLLGR